MPDLDPRGADDRLVPRKYPAGAILDGSGGKRLPVTIDLGTLGGAYMLPAGGRQSLNDKGQVVGDSTTAEGEWRAVLWQRGSFTELGTLPGGAASSAVGVNQAGHVVGISGTASGEFHAFLWQKGTMESDRQNRNDHPTMRLAAGT
jgi:probable HAF family extracellular repeat protein